jgi:N-dimethylarginine dimethylaminohydrolase
MNLSFNQTYSALGGEGWVPRLSALQEEKEIIWAAFGASSECGRLRSVLLRRPGAEIEAVTDASRSLWMELFDPARARDQHDHLAEMYRKLGVQVHYLEAGSISKPNLYFMRDTFAMTPEGAILARPASIMRAGEERLVAQTLTAIGVPIVLSVHGKGTFEGADLMIVNKDLALLARGIRTNAEGVCQVRALLGEIGIREIVEIPLDENCMHLDCMLSIVDRQIALIHPDHYSQMAVQALSRHGFHVLELSDVGEARYGMALNLVAVEPGLVLMPAHNPRTRQMLEGMGVGCVEVDTSELMKGGGAVHCMTGVLQRDAVGS